ncbi:MULTISPECIES: hypothetical protein [Clostridium]|uniref:Uncharacterized protein n=2 Tax=Clostridium TaxID=1485 RepID=A0A1S9I296_9CLOT|nr:MULTISPECIES: hypothetical protein [Clostridium]KOY67276.1 hypothetical protein AN649_03720 [Clostridium sporogenes]MCW6106843.1 hypothetical protein [Clostridium sporogenes]OOO64389.1 hypothetical protein BS638_10880 [Clostridium tepidum]
MTMKEVKESWNRNLLRIKKAEEVANQQPNLFEKYIDNFNELCRAMSYLMQEYENITGEEIPQKNFDNGF